LTKHHLYMTTIAVWFIKVIHWRCEHE